jgi:hypothetical protein
MKRFIFHSLIIFGMIGMTVFCQAVQVDGYCYLENQSNHEGSKVLLQADSPSAVTDSVFTDSTGYYLIELETGVYDIYYTHEGYYDEDMLNRLLLSNTTLQDVTLIEMLQNQISGALSGVISSGNYRVIGNIFVPQNDSLIIEPGTEFQFDGDYEFDIYGYLNAQGDENDSIKFKLTPIAISWDGVDFHDTADDSSRLEYCLITGSDSSGIWCDRSSPTIRHSTIINNTTNYAGANGGGISLDSSDAVIDSCIIMANSVFDDGYGAGIFIGSYSQPIIRDCIISGNTVRVYCYGIGISCFENSSPSIERCIITNNTISYGGYGAGIYCAWSTATIYDCIIAWNSSGDGGHGGGIYLLGSNAIVSHCVIHDNIAGGPQYPGSGGGICYINSSPLIDSCIIENCTIIDNSVGTTTGYGGGIWCAGSGYGPNIVNSIVASNDNGGGICFNGPSTSVYIIYSDFYGNGGGDLIGPNVPEHLGQIVAVNNNGDPCDIFYNIFLNPMLTGNYHLQAGSPCIDAGDPNSPYDPDSTIADIGAFFFDQSSVNDPRDIATPKEFRLYPNYPNPFNASTVLYYSLPQPGVVALSIHNVLGQRVVTLVEGRQTTGVHTITWDASNMASGVYFATMNNGVQVSNVKMLLLK